LDFKSEEKVFAEMQRLLDEARTFFVDKKFSEASHALTILEKTTWLARLVIRDAWKKHTGM